MKFTVADKKILAELNVPEDDFDQIQDATKKRFTTYEIDGRRISIEKAIELLGMKNYLSGIARSAFHMTAVRLVGDGRTVLFDSHNLFKC